MGTSRAAMAVVLAGMSTVAMATEAPRPVLRFLWVDVQQRAEAIRPFVVEETAALLRGAGLEAAWEDGGGAREIKRHEIWVALLSTPHPARATVMGAIVPGRRAVWMFLPAIRMALGLRSETPGLMAPGEARDLGCAVARVLVHELVHIGAPGHPHAGGLMESHLRRPALTAAGVKLDSRMAAALMAATTPAPLQDPPAIVAFAPVRPRPASGAAGLR
jgi:hypothetical protein